MDTATESEASPDARSDPLLVVCLCAQWCGTCRDYRAVLAQARERFASQAVVLFVDIEDDEAWLDGLEVENFPTLLMARGDAVLFFGTVTPHAQTLQRLIESALAGDLKPVRGDAAAQALARRLWQYPRR
jgi:thiol-disulfide isomerase/thioredoxin